MSGNPTGPPGPLMRGKWDEAEEQICYPAAMAIYSPVEISPIFQSDSCILIQPLNSQIFSKCRQSIPLSTMA
jgi:hypothetical protein